MSNNKVIVSVIMATYRRDMSLRNAIKSIEHQNYKHIELIVVDDNADPNWNKIVHSIVNDVHSDIQVIYIVNEINKGSAEARNIGIKNATGSYVTFLDDDDIYLPNKIKNQMIHMQNECSDFSITNIALYDEKDNLVEIRRRKYIKKYINNNLLTYHFRYHLTGTDSLMFDRNYLVKIGGFPLINIGDEFYLVHRAIEGGGKFSYLSTCDVKAYVHTITEGLSSGEVKINGENELFKYKKKYFGEFNFNDKSYISMRHYAVLAFAELRRNNTSNFIKYSILSFLSNPFGCILLFMRRK